MKYSVRAPMKTGMAIILILIVTVKGLPDPDTGFVIDLKKLSTLIRVEVIDKLDHKNLNLDVDFMKDKLGSCENLVIEIWKILEPKISSISKFGKLHSIRLFETPRNYVEYFGESSNLTFSEVLYHSR